jgi:hypothetical protein
MTTTTVTTRICDICKEEIIKTDLYINAGTYGIDAHRICARDLNFQETVRLLILDEIKIMVDDDWDNAKKLAYYTKDTYL